MILAERSILADPTLAPGNAGRRRSITMATDVPDVRRGAIDAVLAENADAVGRYRAGNKNVFGALVGMVMKKTGGRANPKLLKDLLEQKLS